MAQDNLSFTNLVHCEVGQGLCHVGCSTNTLINWNQQLEKRNTQLIFYTHTGTLSHATQSKRSSYVRTQELRHAAPCVGTETERTLGCEVVTQPMKHT